MIKIDLLKNHPQCIQRLSEIWYEVLGKKLLPDISMERVIERFNEHLHEDSLPLTLVAFKEDLPVGMCSMRLNDGLKSQLAPWLGSLVVDPAHQKRGVGKVLMEATWAKAKELGFEKLYLFTADPTLPEYYTRHGWKTIGQDEFRTLPVTVMEIGL